VVGGAPVLRRGVAPGVAHHCSGAIAALILSASALAAQPPAPPPTIHGRIVADTPDSTPIANARVSIAGGAEPIFTDSTGTFAFAGLPPGRYSLTAEKTGYATTRHGAATALDDAVPLTVATGHSIQEIEIRMPRGAAIEGRVVDEYGDPAVNVWLHAYPTWFVGRDIHRAVSLGSPGITDDRGAYRIGGLPAGTYVVSATEMRRQRVFYPAAHVPADAVPIAIGAGEVRSGIDFALTTAGRAPVVAVRLSAPAPAAGAPGGSPRQSPTGQVRFIPNGASGIRGDRSLSFGRRDGSPRVLNAELEPGDWVVLARSGPAGAIAHVTISHDTTVDLDLVPGGRISGRIVVEGGGAPPPVELTVRGVEATAAVAAPGLMPSAPMWIAPERPFDVSGLFGTMQLHAAGLPPGWAVTSIRAGDRELLGRTLTFTGGESLQNTVVTVTEAVGTISGIAIDRHGRAAAGCSVALFADVESPRLVSTERADQHAAFGMADVAAGSYLIAGIEGVAAEFLTPGDWRAAAAFAVPLRLAAADTQRVEVPCVIAR
jgi:Carboxypeptidase regulatory-like domain